MRYELEGLRYEISDSVVTPHMHSALREDRALLNALPHPVVVRNGYLLDSKNDLTFGQYLPSSQQSPIFEAPASQ